MANELESGVMPVVRAVDPSNDEIRLGCEAIMNQVAVIDLNLEFLGCLIDGEALEAHEDVCLAVERIIGVVRAIRRVVELRARVSEAPPHPRKTG
jgi:hypothetical protein